MLSLVVYAELFKDSCSCIYSWTPVPLFRGWQRAEQLPIVPCAKCTLLKMHPKVMGCNNTKQQVS